MMTIAERPPQPARATVDVAAVKASADLLALIERDTTLRKAASTRGGEWCGPCPFCGGRDRLRVQPEPGRWWCRQCSGEHWQDAISYVMRRDGVGFREACARLGGETVSPPTTSANGNRGFHFAPEPEPSEEWRAAGLALVEEAERLLWSDQGKRARGWLHERGLTENTLKTWRLGYLPTDRTEPLRAARGIVLPWFLDGELWNLKIRRPSGTPKYVSVSGGHPLLYGAHTLKGQHVAVLTEGEFDALLAWQEAGELMGTATLGGCSNSLRPRARRYLLTVPRVLVCYDNDADGEKWAPRLVASSARMRQIHVPAGNDLTEFWQQDGDVLEWLLAEAGTHYTAPIEEV